MICRCRSPSTSKSFEPSGPTNTDAMLDNAALKDLVGKKW